MVDSLSVNVDSTPKLELYTKQAHRTPHEAEHSDSPSSIQKAIAELVGTYILIFAGCGLPLTIVGIAIVSGLALTVATYSVGHVSGGHFNPAVTIALAAVRKIQLKLRGTVLEFCQLTGVAIGISVLISVIIAGPITGASMNPARSLGPAIVSGDYKNIWVFIIGPTLGAVSATMLYTFLRVAKPNKPEPCHMCSHNHFTF